ncbi:MAG: hypothetical protein QOD72_546 [Acidimicrobiaceae bacterium]|jgi:protein-S-isoprenylcysteine O-methyltransferase Ste14|nr:hypothetical protein [Acidimicrobiaceae bacterium]
MVLALTTDNIKVIALVAIVAFVVIGVVSSLVIKAIAGRLIALLLMVALAVLVWTQRSSISTCTKTAKQNYATGKAGKTTCSFFGREVDVDLPAR